MEGEISMGFRFRKSIKIAPGIRFNVGTKSAGVSFGGKGLRYSINSRRGGSLTVPAQEFHTLRAPQLDEIGGHMLINAVVN